MSCVVAYITPKKIIMGGDSAITCQESDESINMENKKVFIKDKKFLIGCAGSQRDAQLIEHVVEIPKQTKQDSSDEYYICNKVIGAIRDCFFEHGGSFVTPKEGESDSIESEILLAYKGRLYNILPDFGIAVYTNNFHAVGTGRPYAIGALKAFEIENKLSVEDKILRSLEISADCVSSVNGPFYTLSLDIPSRKK